MRVVALSVDMADELRAYLDLSPEEARAQRGRFLQREQCNRQERFLPVEVLLCFGLFSKLNPHQFGGRNIDQVPTGSVSVTIVAISSGVPTFLQSDRRGLSANW
jgi:hypothetical protein